ncbi:MAG TPA: HesA/MoeB/ThiF family protein [Candidatus Methanoculleus thermohydrogenotrophicum]|jgi:adenylyltransferase/sulfurtransferase|nr:HesA/MoeB/ThiF family protein [Candidatus Methanoculleus thermohydrogenotrophicum]NLM82589.1 HesA/MoeB/ThiF family protein [Candidatus Methanoculleus thermohydrogenotrophicum]HOB18092.1 HesA/MoeB/ThiF family protein [Candidatus Methanoculleus thermohydrogenotrophicum]HPZ37808.1 HesA/MoeB/ThiF family protein [Candidatus Methanoculleus thermohydrogenotrophicum]HQC91989.1 HesA/MoeB/ThiF family protein [Candidatus Methanoculleus thermohydrogenotrophicum]
MLTDRELERYQRQIALFGEEAQARLASARVVIVGAGGLGCPVALYLAAAGIGEIRLIDGDVVDRTNLNRQVLHGDRDIGRAKVESAAEKLRAQNPEIRVVTRYATIDEGNAAVLAGGADLIIDATDNFPARYILNRVALQSGVPLIHGAVRGFDGQATTIIPGRTACLACIFPIPPPEEEVVPMVGTTPGIIGLVQANEAVKYITSTGDLLANRLLVWDGRAATMATLEVERQENCSVCGDGRC